jgi:hypothetical protein
MQADPCILLSVNLMSFQLRSCCVPGSASIHHSCRRFGLCTWLIALRRCQISFEEGALFIGISLARFVGRELGQVPKALNTISKQLHSYRST